MSPWLQFCLLAAVTAAFVLLPLWVLGREDDELEADLGRQLHDDFF